LFVNPIHDEQGWGRAAIQVAFTVFVFTETWLVPIEGWFVDRYGPRIVVMFGGALVAVAWVLNSFAATLFVLYAGAVIAGVGAGAVYGTCVGNALKWFPDRRGLAAGATAAGFGAGAALTVIPIAETIENFGYHVAFLAFASVRGSLLSYCPGFFARRRRVPWHRPPRSAARSRRRGSTTFRPRSSVSQCFG
jgi:OFA family oxalate/formate antiporter-like MFS transporter